jgi:hypothetical protein
MEFTFKGEKYKLDKKFWAKEYKTHPMPNSTIEFQFKQIQYLISTNDFTTLKNRIINMLKWGGIIKLK